MRSMSDWEFVRQEGNVVFIRDLDLGRMSVTNDADNVFDDCQELYGNPSCRVVYLDTDGNWDEIVIDEITQRPLFYAWCGESPRSVVNDMVVYVVIEDDRGGGPSVVGVYRSLESAESAADGSHRWVVKEVLEG